MGSVIFRFRRFGSRNSSAVLSSNEARRVLFSTEHDDPVKFAAGACIGVHVRKRGISSFIYMAVAELKGGGFRSS